MINAEDHLALAGSVYQPFAQNARHRSDREELWSAALEGLAKAVLRYKPESGFKFSTYAVPTIRGALIDFVRWRDGRYRRNPSFVEFKATTRSIRDPEACHDLAPYLARLVGHPREETAVRMYYLEGYSQPEIGRHLGVNPSRVCQIVKSGIRRMRKADYESLA